MTVGPVPLFSRAYKNADGTVLSDDSAVQYNGYLDDLQGVNIRPGEIFAGGSGKSVDGLFAWSDKNLIVSVESGTVYLWRVLGSRLVLVMGATGGDFATGFPVSFTNDLKYTFMAAGGKINCITSSGTFFQITDSNAPPNITHLAFLDGYILAINGDDGRFFFSVIPETDPLTFAALNFATAEGAPDKLISLVVVQRQAYLLGTTTTEIWENDGDSPFSRIPGGMIEIGCIAKYSPIKLDNSLMWLDHKRRIVQFTGTDVKYISSRYDKEIEKFEVVSDCIGGYVFKDGQEFCVFQFPTEGRTLVYNPASDDWTEWATWNQEGGKWEAYDFRATCRDIGSGKVFIGKGDAGCIACLDSDSRVDLKAPNTVIPFKFLRLTGHLDHGVSMKKVCEYLSFRAKRGGGPIEVTNPKLMLRYRDNGSQRWSNIKEIDLGNIGDTEHHVILRRLGIYRSRQYEISATDNVPIVLSNAEVDVTVLR